MIDILIISIISAYVVIKLFLDINQINYINNTKTSNEELVELNLSNDYIATSNSYNIEKLYLSVTSLIIQISIVLFFLFFNGIEILRIFVLNLNIQSIDNEILMVVSFMIILTFIKLPLAFYKTFKIEEKYGFNKSSVGLFFKDTFLSILISILITIILFKSFMFLYYNYEESWWYLMWAVFMIFNFIILYIYPTLISPIFNKFKKITDIKIINVINDLTEKTKFNIQDVYVMDGSKRSRHSNAYFTGFYKNKRIVFFDTLLEMLNVEEIKSVLAHEIGHYKKKHIIKSLYISMFISLIVLYALYILSSVPSFFSAFGITNITPSILVIVYTLLLPMVAFFSSPFLSSFSRMNEYEADDFAKEYANKNALISSLLKLYKENLSIIKSSPIYSKFYNSHPTVFERINNLKL
ncbi:MAG: M48 family metallopeptidase [Pelagibacterales bacterium]|nr:M48 family metallopeptidase [Pelagibacterales bacterium]